MKGIDYPAERWRTQKAFQEMAVLTVAVDAGGNYLMSSQAGKQGVKVNPISVGQGFRPSTSLPAILKGVS
ncbi:MAG: hypothetical protein AAF198_06410 [Pseudomonadota bacterium]